MNSATTRLILLVACSLPLDLRAQIIHVERPDPFVAEDAGAIHLRLLREGDLSGRTTVRYAVDNGCDTVLPFTGVIEWLGGQAERRLTIPIPDNPTAAHDVIRIDGNVESFESCGLKVTFSEPTGVTLWNRDRESDRVEVEISVLENEHPPAVEDSPFGVRFQARRVAQPVGLPQIEVAVLRAGVSSQEVSVQFETVDGTALAGRDYIAQRGTVSFPSLVTKGLVRIPLTVPAGGTGARSFKLAIFHPNSDPPWRQEAQIVLEDTLRPGGVDPTFDAGEIIGVVPDVGGLSVVEDVAVLPNGQIYVGGHISWIQGSVRDAIAKLNHDGSLDETYPGPSLDHSTLGGDIHHLHLQNSGTLTAWNQTPRLFDASGALVRSLPHVYCVAVTADGRLLGFAERESGVFVWPGMLRRFSADGEVDPSFSPIPVQGDAWSVATEAEGTLLIVLRDFGSEFPRLMRWNRDGSPDLNSGAASFSGFVNTVITDREGRILVGGSITRCNGEPCAGLIRLNADGSMDRTFEADEVLTVSDASRWIRAIAVQQDGKVLVGGQFGRTSQTLNGGLVRLHPDGSLDDTFNVGEGISSTASLGMGRDCCFVNRIALQPDGQILVSGAFDTFAGFHRVGLVRLHGDFRTGRQGPLLQTGGAADDRVQFTLNGMANREYVIEVSVNLRDWRVHGTVDTDTYGHAPLIEEVGTSQQFYRLRAVE